MYCFTVIFNTDTYIQIDTIILYIYITSEDFRIVFLNVRICMHSCGICVLILYKYFL